jgi:hypothetical protein
MSTRSALLSAHLLVSLSTKTKKLLLRLSAAGAGLEKIGRDARVVAQMAAEKSMEHTEKPE